MERPGGEEERSYELGDVTPENMLRVNEAVERKALDNRIDNDKNMVNAYSCQKCGKSFAAVAVDVGATPYVANCEAPGCDGTAVGEKGSWGKNHVDDYRGTIAYEWYRPLTEEECEVAVSLIEAEASMPRSSGRVEGAEEMGGFFSELGRKDGARSLLEGGFLRRPRGA